MTAASNEVALLPCPFCGGVPLLMGFNAPEFWVSCVRIGCKAGTEAFGSKDRAIAAWNTRAHSDPRPVAVEIEAAAQLACEAFYGNDWQWGMLDEGFRQKWRDVVAASALATHSPAPMAGGVRTFVQHLRNRADSCDCMGYDATADQIRQAADLIERLAAHPSTQEGGK